LDTVFVVDDDPSVREALTSLLRSTGLRVVAFASGKEFLSQRRPESPACLVLDLRLPGMGGFEVLHDLSQGGDPTPVIFITGHGSIPACVQAMRAGAVDFLTKPFCAEELLAAIRCALDVDERTRTKGRYTAQVRNRFATLTRREREVM
jgi:FixJ family two-component response regulator